MEGKTAGFREIEHTADWELEVWAPDLCSLFEQTARGMYTLCSARFINNQVVPRILEIKARDNETLLVHFLSELLYFYENEGIGFEKFNLRIKDNLLHAEMDGLKIVSMAKEIKAVTFHNLEIRETGHGWKVNLVFDV